MKTATAGLGRRTPRVDKQGSELRRMRAPDLELRPAETTRGPSCGRQSQICIRSLLRRCPSYALWQEAPGALMCSNRFSTTSNFDDDVELQFGHPKLPRLAADVTTREGPRLSTVRVAPSSNWSLAMHAEEWCDFVDRSFATCARGGRPRVPACQRSPSHTSGFPHGGEGCARRRQSTRTRTSSVPRGGECASSGRRR